MNEEEKKWQLSEEHMGQVEEEQQKPQNDLFSQCSVGCFIGGILGPVFLIALFFIDAALHPDAAAGGPLGYLFLLILAVPIGGIFTAVLSPFIMKWVKKLKGRKRK